MALFDWAPRSDVSVVGGDPGPAASGLSVERGYRNGIVKVEGRGVRNGSR